MKRTFIPSLIVVLGLIAFLPPPATTSAQVQKPPCSNKWFEINSGVLTPGPLLPPGLHRIWVGKKVQKTGTIAEWRSFGPYQVKAETKYLVTLSGDATVGGLRPNDAAISGYPVVVTQAATAGLA